MSAAPSWIGTTLAFRGLRADLVSGSPAIVPPNAMMVAIGL